MVMTLGLGAEHGLSAPSEAAFASMTAGTYNVRVAVLPAQIDDWVNNRRHLVFQSIVANQPHFMGFQEAYARRTGTAGITQQTALGQLFTGTKWQFFSWEAQNAFNMNPIIVDTDRFSPVASGSSTVNFIDFLGAAGWKDFFDLHTFFHGNGGGNTHFLGPERYVNWVVADDLVGGGRVAFLTSHYETYIGENKKGSQYDDLFEYFSDLVNSSFGYASGEIVAQANQLKSDWGDLEAIIGGDFETQDPELPAQKVYEDSGYAETWRFVNGNGKRPTKGIDNMFVMPNGFDIDDSYYDTAAHTNGASDHKPLYAEVTLSPCLPVTYCSVADGSVDNTAGLSATGCSLFGPNSLVLSNAPQNQLCYLLIGAGTGMISDPPGALGDLCLLGGGSLGRYARDVGPISATGTFSTDISDSLSGGAGYGIPGKSGQSIQVGETWNFQYWYRRPNGQPSGFSEALSVTFK